MNSSIALWRISVTATAEAEDAVAELLASITGLAAAAYFDMASQASHVSVFAEQGTFSPTATRRQIAAGLKHIKDSGLDTGAARIQILRVKREDWAESWKRHFRPIEIWPTARKPAPRQRRPQPLSLLIKPGWSRRRAGKNQRVVVLDPGLSFGTGQHPTTAFCLREIVRRRAMGSGQSFLDAGTGSGILAIAAAKLGYAPVHGFDFDPQAVRAAMENVRKNRVAGRVTITQADITRLPLRPPGQFDLICANLISNLLISERERIVRRLLPGGVLVLAGILAVEFPEVARAFARSNLELRASTRENEWQSGAFCFRWKNLNNQTTRKVR